MVRCTVGARVRLHVHLKLDTAFSVCGKIPDGNGIKRKCMRKPVMIFRVIAPELQTAYSPVSIQSRSVAL